MSAEELLAKVRDHKPTKRGSKKVWERPERTHFLKGLVLCFDQTLSKTGWTLLSNNVVGIGVEHGGMLKAKPSGLTGFEETLAKDAMMEGQVLEVMQAFAIYGFPTPDAIVHEMPAVGGHRTESSLMGAAIVRRCARQVFPQVPVHMINRQAAYATIVGDRHAPKKDGTAAVERILQFHDTDQWNQDVHDSVVLGLKYLYLEPGQR